MSSAPYNKNITPLEAARQSSKLMRAAKETEKSLKQGRNKIFAYTNWLEAGAIPYQHLLESQGIKSAVFHGGLSPREKQQLVNEYNNGDLQVLIGTSSAGEGLDLKNTRLIQVLDPHFNESRIKQAIGRGIRLGSHNALPEDQRNVKVQRYYSQPIKKPGIFARLLLQARDTSGKGADEWLHDRAVEKQRLIDSLVQIMGEATNRPVAG
jgi:superfamily II DNA/RNA helicase